MSTPTAIIFDYQSQQIAEVVAVHDYDFDDHGNGEGVHYAVVDLKYPNGVVVESHLVTLKGVSVN